MPDGTPDRDSGGLHVSMLRPRRTHRSNKVFSLPGGTEDNDLWVEVNEQIPGHVRLISTWVPSEAQRQAIAEGANLDLVVWGVQHPPVAVCLSATPIGKAPNDDDAAG